MSATALLAYYLECTDLFAVHVQGFFCHDPELLKPYPGSDEVSFVPPLVLYCVVAATPTAVVSLRLTNFLTTPSLRHTCSGMRRKPASGRLCWVLFFLSPFVCPCGSEKSLSESGCIQKALLSDRVD